MTSIRPDSYLLTFTSRSIPILKEQNINQEISSNQVQLISSDGKNLGIVNTSFALYQANIQNLDLVQIAYKDGTPICQILEYSKFKYEQQKKQKEAKKKQLKIIQKEIRLSPRIEEHDIKIKISKISELIAENAIVRVSMQFRGRENNYKNLGIDIMEKFKNIPGTTASEMNFTGNQIALTLTKVN